MSSSIIHSSIVVYVLSEIKLGSGFPNSNLTLENLHLLIDVTEFL